jgi:O-methyltransferase involved in polyketide biosynthesis
LRTAQLDHLVRKHFQTFPEGLLLELGCGFSTRFSRLGRPGGRWYELDLPEMIELRASFGFPEARNHWHLAASLTEPDWPTWLPAGQAEALLIVAEGLFMYFPETEVRLLLQRLQQHFKGALIAFDVIGQWNLKAAQRAALETQSPIYWGVPDLRHCATAFGLKAAGELYLADYLNQTPAAQDYVSWLGHHLLRWPAWRARQGGTVLARL